MATLNRRQVLAMLGAGGGLVGLGCALRGGSGIAVSEARPDGSNYAASPPPSLGEAVDGYDDLSAAFLPGWTSPAVAADGFSVVSTPYGDGFEFIVPDSKIAPWDSTCKALLAVKNPATSPIGREERWTFNMLLPKQSLADTWHTGVLWEFHTNTGSGHHLALNSNSTFRIARDIAPGASTSSYVFTTGPAVPWDQWMAVTLEVKWSYSADGYYKVWMDGVQYVDATGVPTVFDGTPYLQFGWYAQRGAGITNRIQVGGIHREEF
ncbi:MAG: hypothetical protein JWQ86_1785 [Mycobacterium sp.]|nr:hypothetical protein [Mycobacterium sp.]